MENKIKTAEVVKNILTEVVNNITKEEEMEEEMENKIKTAIEPTKDFLTNTAVTWAEMIDDIADQIEEVDQDEFDDTEEL